MTKDGEGVPITSYGQSKQISGEVWPASGKLQTQMYGERLSYIRNCKVEGKYTIRQEKNHVVYDFEEFQLREGDGICVYTSIDQEPDYKIISIKPYNPLYMELEKL